MKARKKNKPTEKKITKKNSKQARQSTESGFRVLRSLFTDQLKDIYWAEKALVKLLKRMQRNATHDELSEALEKQLVLKKEQLERLEDVFREMNEKPVAVKCEAMVGLVKEAENSISETTKGMLRDASIIASAQKAVHYEIATYCMLCSLARNLGEEESASLLLETLEQEKEMNEKLGDISDNLLQEEMESRIEYADEEEDLKALSKKKAEIAILV